MARLAQRKPNHVDVFEQIERGINLSKTGQTNACQKRSEEGKPEFSKRVTRAHVDDDDPTNPTPMRARHDVQRANPGKHVRLEGLTIVVDDVNDEDYGLDSRGQELW